MLAKLCGRLASALIILAVAAWGALALFYGNAGASIEALRSLLLGLFGLAGIVAAAAILLFSRRRWRAAGRLGWRFY
jgi:uncharacterized membrane protein YhaH (DUF805 family)